MQVGRTEVCKVELSLLDFICIILISIARFASYKISLPQPPALFFGRVVGHAAVLLALSLLI